MHKQPLEISFSFFRENEFSQQPSFLAQEYILKLFKNHLVQQEEFYIVIL